MQGLLNAAAGRIQTVLPGDVIIYPAFHIVTLRAPPSEPEEENLQEGS